MMFFEIYQDVFYIVTYAVAVVVLSVLADRKNRSPLAWGTIGALLFPISLICLMLETPLKPRSGKDKSGSV
jgi:uncharacterized membrane protein